MLKIIGALTAASLLLAGAAQAQAPKSDTTAFRAIYKELVETNTTASSGDCTLAAQRMAARLKAAGYPDSDLTVFTAPGFPKSGGLVGAYPGAGPNAKANLVVDPLHCVGAKRPDRTPRPLPQ